MDGKPGSGLEFISWSVGVAFRKKTEIKVVDV